MYRAGIAGATGYTGLELIQIIHRHPQMELGWVTSESSAGQPYSQVHPVPWDYPLIPLAEALARADEVDVVFLCLPHTASIGPVRAFRDTGVRVVDLSADFRLLTAEAYAQWYGVDHTAPELMADFVYGLAEVYRDDLRGAMLIANPGCYPTSVNLGLYPLAWAGWLSEKVIIDSKSGISGAGRKAKLVYNFVEAHDNMSPYNVGYRHRHIGEIEQVLDPADPTGIAASLLLHAAPAAREPGHPEHHVRQRAQWRDAGRCAGGLRRYVRGRAVHPPAAAQRAGHLAPRHIHKPLRHQHHTGQPK